MIDTAVPPHDDPRPSDHETLLPWHVRAEHRDDPDFDLLRLERRRRNGRAIPAAAVPRLDEWVSHLQRHRLVVAYDDAVGFSLVPARAGVDTGLIRLDDVRDPAA